MSQSIKLKNNTYLDSSSITDDRKKLSDMLNGNAPMGNIVVDSIRGKNLLNLNQCTLTNCTLYNDSSVKSNITNDYFCVVSLTYLNNYLLANKGKSITLSIGQAITNKSITILIRGTRTGGETYQEIYSSVNKKTITGTIASDFTSITSLDLRFNRSTSSFTDTTTIIEDIMLQIGTTSTDYAPYQGLLDENNIKNKELVVGGIRSKNMIGYFEFGTLNDTDGSESATTNAKRTDFIEVDFSNSNYTLSGMPTSYNHFVCAYNSNKQFLGRTGKVGVATETLTSSSFTSGTPQGTGSIKYIRLTIYNGPPDSVFTTIQLEKGNTATTFAPYQGLGYVSGQNSNGYYVKYDDGRLEQWGTFKIPANSQSKNITLPISFISNDYFVFFQNVYYNKMYFFWGYGNIQQSSFKAYVCTTSDGTPTVETGAEYLAIGRWK